MPKAGYLQKVYVRSDTTAPSATDEVDGITSFSLSRSVDMEETTDFADDGGYKTRMGNLIDTSCEMSGHAEMADTIQDLIRSSWLSRSTVYVTVHTDTAASAGSKGVRVPMLVESYDFQGEVGSAIKFSVKFVGNGAVTEV